MCDEIVLYCTWMLSVRESHHESVWFLLFTTQRPTTVCRTWHVTPSSRSPRSAGVILFRFRWARWCLSSMRSSTTSTPSSATCSHSRSVPPLDLLSSLTQLRVFDVINETLLLVSAGPHVLRGRWLHDCRLERSGRSGAAYREVHAAA